MHSTGSQDGERERSRLATIGPETVALGDAGLFARRVFGVAEET